MSDPDPMRFRRYALGEEPAVDDYLLTCTPEQLVDMVWEISRDVWSAMGVDVDEEFRRDVGRITRG